MSLTKVSYSMINGAIANVLDFGAVGDGITDDTAAIQAAHATGLPVWYPYGTYKYVGYFPECEGGIIGEGWSTNNGAKKTTIVFYNCTNTAKGALTVKTTNPSSAFFRISNIQIFASSWDGTTGCLGYGLDIGAPVIVDNVYVQGFAKSNIFIHQMTPVNSNAPYESLFNNVFSAYSGQHGCFVGAGANVLTFINYQGKWNGATSFGVIPAVAGSYDGFYTTQGDDGAGYTAYNPQGLTVIGGDCSYNARYGWNFYQVTDSPTICPVYAEGNLASGGYQAALGTGVGGCTISFGNIDSSKIYVNAYTPSSPFNNIYAKGQLIGYGGISYLLSDVTSIFTPGNSLSGTAINGVPSLSGYSFGRYGSGSYLTWGGNSTTEIIGFTENVISFPRNVFFGDGSDAVSISNVTNNGSGLIRVTTSSAHGYSSGQRVQILQASGVPNTTGYITVINTTTFDINGTTFTGTYVSGGFSRAVLLRGISGGIPTGQGVQGDIVWNTYPSSGNPIGWTCTATGNPGTWKGFGTIA